MKISSLHQNLSVHVDNCTNARNERRNNMTGFIDNKKA